MSAIADNCKHQAKESRQLATLGGMGTLTHLSPGEFSLQFNSFLGRVVEDGLNGRLTARWAEKNMPPERKKEYWHKLLTNKQSLTTEDISLIADWLDVSPFVFVDAVKTNDLDLVRAVSSWMDDDLLDANEEERRRRGDMALAALRRKRYGTE